MAKIGYPDKTPVMIQTQQHGNEPIGTESALKGVKALSTGNESAMKILNELYVLIIVRTNPDGAELWQRYNDDPTAPNRSTSKYIYTSGGVPAPKHPGHWDVVIKLRDVPKEELAAVLGQIEGQEVLDVQDM